jgi:hypothetical protein
MMGARLPAAQLAMLQACGRVSIGWRQVGLSTSARVRSCSQRRQALISSLVRQIDPARSRDYLSFGTARWWGLTHEGAPDLSCSGEHDWRTFVRPAIRVGPDDPLLNVLRLGIVLGRNGTPIGIVTLEDILEEILGGSVR